jgi:hypothetical protein
MIKKEKETPPEEKEIDKGRSIEVDYFFPDKMVVIKASSMQEAIKKYNELK